MWDQAAIFIQENSLALFLIVIFGSGALTFYIMSRWL